MQWIPRALVVEFVISFVLGGAPALILYFSGGVGSLDTLVQSLPDGFMLWYTVAISALPFAVLLLARWRSRAKPTGVVMDVMLELYDQLHGVYRFAAGFLLTFVGIWHFDDCGSVDWRAWVFIGFGMFSYAVCIFYSAGKRFVESTAAAA